MQSVLMLLVVARDPYMRMYSESVIDNNNYIIDVLLIVSDHYGVYIIKA